MRTMKGLMSVVVILFVVGYSANNLAYATASNISFAITGYTPTKTGPSPLNIEGTYTKTGGGGTIIIGPFGGNAVIEFNEAADWLRMKNAEIRSTSAPIDNVKFEFSRSFEDLVTGPTTYSINGSGYFSRSTVATDPIDWISARGHVEGTLLGSPTLTSPPPSSPPPCTLKLTRCADHSPANWSFNLNSPNNGFKTSHNFGDLATGSDELKAAFWIHLEKTTDRLYINAAPGIRVKFGPPAGEAEECENAP